MNQPENGDLTSSNLLNKLPQEIRERIFILSGVPHHQLVQCFSGLKWFGVIPRNEQTERLRKLDDWSVSDEPPNYWDPAPLGPRAGPSIWSSPADFFSRRAYQRRDLLHNYYWDTDSFPPIMERDPTPTSLTVACSQLRDEVESLIYSQNTFITFLDWESKLSNTIKTRLSPNNRAKIRKLIVFVKYGTIESIRLRGNLEEGGFLPEAMANLTMLCIVITQPFILKTAEKSMAQLAGQETASAFDFGTGQRHSCLCGRELGDGCYGAVRDVLGPDRCCFQNINVVDYVEIYRLEWVGVR